MLRMVNGRFEVVVYPKDLDALELSLSRLGWEVAERFADVGETRGVSFRLPVDEVRLELVTHTAARSLTDTLGSDVMAGLRVQVSDADAAWETASAAGLTLDPVCSQRPSEETWGRLVRAYAAGGLRLDFVQPPG
jgi:hypothetical protein